MPPLVTFDEEQAGMSTSSLSTQQQYPKVISQDMHSTNTHVDAIDGSDIVSFVANNLFSPPFAFCLMFSAVALQGSFSVRTVLSDFTSTMSFISTEHKSSALQELEQGKAWLGTSVSQSLRNEAIDMET